VIISGVSPAPSTYGQEQTPGSVREDAQSLLVRGSQLIRAKKYAEAASQLQEYVLLRPDNLNAVCLLALANFKADRRSEALGEFKQIQNLPPTAESQTCIKKLTPVLRPELNQELEKSLDSELANLKSSDALSTIDQMYLEPHQKELLKFYVDRRQGNLANALLRLSTIRSLKTDSPTESLNKEVAEDAAIFQKIKSRVDWYRYSALTNGTCTPDWVRKEIPKQDYSLQEYARLVANAEQHFPLNSWVMDQAFFATLLGKPYEDVESLGDKILAAKGTLRVPFYSRDSLFELVIDTKNHRLYTQADGRFPANEAGSDRMLPLEPFDVHFEQISSLSQRAPSDVDTLGLGKQSFALRLSPRGTAPHYAFMDVVHCLYGEGVQKTVTANLGAFIVHVVHNAKLSPHLVNPESKTHDWLHLMTNSIALGTIATAQVENINSNNEMKRESGVITAQSMKVLAENKAEAARSNSISAAQKEEADTWHQQMLKIVFSAIEADRAEELEKFEHKLLAAAEGLPSNAAKGQQKVLAP
jgi:hypothetical protein